MTNPFVDPFGRVGKMHGLAKAGRAGARKFPGLPPLLLLGAYGSPPLSANPINISFNPSSIGANKTHYGGQWSNFDATFPVKLGDWLEITGTNNGNDGLYGPIIAFEKLGPFEWDVAVFDADFPNPNGVTTPAVVHVWTPDNENTLLITGHDTEITLSGDPSSVIDLENPADSWASFSVVPGDTIRIDTVSAFAPGGSDPSGLRRVASLQAANRIQLWPVFTPSTQFDVGGIDVSRIN